MKDDDSNFAEKISIAEELGHASNKQMEDAIATEKKLQQDVQDFTGKATQSEEKEKDKLVSLETDQEGAVHEQLETQTDNIDETLRNLHLQIMAASKELVRTSSHQVQAVRQGSQLVLEREPVRERKLCRGRKNPSTPLCIEFVVKPDKRGCDAMRFLGRSQTWPGSRPRRAPTRSGIRTRT